MRQIAEREARRYASSADVDEIVQEALVRAWRRRSSLRSADSEPWMRQIARNEALRLLDRKRRVLDASHLRPIATSPSLPSDETTASAVSDDRRSRSRPEPLQPPPAALRLFPHEDAVHYAIEWGAHLWELAQEGAHHEARRHRRRMALAAPLLALQLHWSALARRRSRASR